MAEVEEEIEEEIEEEVEEEVEKKVDEETLSLAKSMGWVEEEKFRGDKSNWVDAEKFVERGMNDLPILRERVRSQAQKLKEMESDVQDFKKHHEDSLSREYQRAMEEIQRQQLAIVEEGDVDKYKELEEQKRTLALNHSQNIQHKPPENPIYLEWKNENSWFESDPEMTTYANRMSDFIAETRPELVGKRAFLDEVEKEVKTRFKDKFENPKREEPPTVEGSGRQRRQKTGRTFEDLPQEAKDACMRFIRRGLMENKEQYLREYEWE